MATTSQQIMCYDSREDSLCLIMSTGFNLAYPGLVRYPDGEGIYAAEMIADGRLIGEIYGIPAYIFDISGHTDYIIIDGDMVLDVSGSGNGPNRSMITYIRESNETSAMANCRIVCRENRFYVIATRSICVGEEIVYDSHLFLAYPS